MLTPANVSSHGTADHRRALLVWRFSAPMHCLSSAPVGGGQRAVEWAINATVASDFAETDLDAFVQGISASEELSGAGVGFLTAADVAQFATAVNEGVLVEASVGVTRPTWAADGNDTYDTWRPGTPSPRRPGTPSPRRPGTINIVAQLPVPLSPAAAVNAIITITEAKSQALFEAEVPGTGTASDAVAVLWPNTDETPEAFGGPRSTWGARLARATHQAVAQGLASHP